MRQKPTKKGPEVTRASGDPRAAVVRRILNIAQITRQKGMAIEADEALRWEKQLEARLREIEQSAGSEMPQAA